MLLKTGKFALWDTPRGAISQQSSLLVKEDMMNTSKKSTPGLAWLGLIAAAFLCLQPMTALSATVEGSCSQGTGIPPFLSSGTDANLLLLLDNSASMLDMAYVETIGTCTDNAFDTTATYTGLYDPDKWYKWTDGTQQWQSGATYLAGDYVYSEGVFYQAGAGGGTSIGVEIGTDSGVSWTEVYVIVPWRQGTVYPAKSFVQYDQQLYYTTFGGTANDPDLSDGLYIGDDTGVSDWMAVESTWLNGEVYVNGDIVSGQGMLFQATNTATSSGSNVWDDTAVNWVRLDEGFFEEATFTTSTDAAAAFAAKTGDAYSQDNLYIKVVSVGTVQSGVTAFAASGKLLNWATASKFDIEKKILTGGKYNVEAQSLVSQSRGCSSHGFVKEVSVVDSVGSSQVISFSIQGPSENSWIDTTDNTTRISILGISDGFIDSVRDIACQAAIDSVAAGYDDGQGTTKQNIATCLAYTGGNNILAESNAAYNHSIHSCWEKTTKNYTTPSDFGNVNEIINACENIYDLGVPPSTINPTNSGYMCMGAYNQALPDARTPTGTGSDREGYIGRCWETGSVPAGCQPISCPTEMSYTTGSPRCFPDGYVYECSGNYNSTRNTCNKPWQILLEDADLSDGITCDTTATATPGVWTDDSNPNSADACIQEGLWDYCQSLTIPEVIDPSDQTFNTGDTWGMPGAMIDSGIVSMFGSEHALIVMKGYIKQTTAPTGILHEVAPNLRLGAMAFNDNGAETECSSADVSDTIVEYCPDENKDGADLISPIMGGMEVTDDNGTSSDPNDDIHHVDDMTVAINNIRATAWTPLAEALYNAIGYYGQNDGRRLNDSPDADFLTAAETNGPPDPVQYWCQDNNILLITEGASTADINQEVINFVNAADPDNAAAEKQCPDLYGSTYLDDLTYYGQNADASALYATPTASPGYLQDSDGTYHPKQNINTYVVTTGILRDNGTADECNPATIMTNAADNGGTSLLTGEDPAQLEANLRAALGDIMNRASAGSAASVISSSRTGEGAAYQAIFWPNVPRGAGEDALSWIGDVHSLFVDSASQMWDDYSGNTGTADPQNKTGKVWSEDSNGNGQFDAGEDSNSNGCLDGDRRIFFYYDQTDKETKICFNDSVRASDPPVCDTSLTDYCGSFTEPASIKDFDDYLWSANQHLEDVVVIDENRSVNTTSGKWDWTSPTGKKRYIFTWNDLNNDGIVDSREVLGLDNKTATYDGTDWSLLNNTSDTTIQHNILDDFNIDSTLTPTERVEKMNELVNWLRGADEVYESTTGTDTNGDPTFTDTNGNGKQDYVYRCRRYPNCDPTDTASNPEWRLGDIIHSTPTLVAQPAEAFHTLYSDTSYAWFVKKYRYRRQVVYFGANDGMMHAFNAGFFHEGTKSFCREINPNYDPTDTTNDNPCLASGPEVGDELWAYIPYNLQPHLKCLSDPEYNHKYFVDQKPRIMDVQIFEEETECADVNDPACIHPYGWGTIMIGAMGFGGAPVDANDATPIIGTPAVNRRFISSYFVLDVTDPERPPELLGEMTMTTTSTLNADDNSVTVEPNYAELGYTVPVPTGAVMRADDGSTNWYLVFGNGPTTLKGENTQQGKVAVLPLNWLKGDLSWNGTPPKPTSYDTSTRRPFQIPIGLPSATTNEGGFFPIPVDTSSPETAYSFTGDLVNVDYNINSRMTSDLGAIYRSDAIYFGTVDGTGFVPYVSGDPLYDSNFPAAKHWDGGGRLYRLVTQTSPYSDQPLTEPHDWELKLLLDAKAPITAAPQISWDGYSNWIYFGTGRFFDKDDKTDKDQNYFFGLKEPMLNRDDCSATADHYLTWDTINYDVSDSLSPWASPSFTPGSRGLFQADQVLVVEKPAYPTIGYTPYAFCKTPGCQLSDLGITDLGSGKYAFDDMRNYIAGSCDATTNLTKGIDGWYRLFEDPRERNIGQSTLLGGLVTFTTYQPSSDICTAEGQSFLYGVHYQTGTAWYENVFGTYTHTSGEQIVRDKLSLGLGMAKTPSIHVGSTGTNEATALIESSTGEIIEIGQENLPIPLLRAGKTGWTDQCN